MLKAKSIKRFTKTLTILLAIETLLLLTIATYYYFTYAKKVPIVNLNQPIEFNFSSLSYTTDFEVKEPYKLASLDILPSEYDSFSKSIGETLTQHEKTQLLLYSQTEHLSKSESITDGYEILLQNNLGILIPQEYIDMYFVSKIYSVAHEILNEDVNKSTKDRLDLLLGTQQSSFIQNCISKDQTTILKGLDSTCVDTTEGYSLSKLFQKLIFTQDIDTVKDSYRQYIKNNLFTYSINKDISEYTEKISEPKIFNYYFDTDLNHQYQIKYIYDYINTIYLQLGKSIPVIETQLQQIKEYNDSLIKYSEEPLKASLNTLAQDIIQSSSVDISTDTQLIIEKLMWYMKVVEKEDSEKMYIAPVYLFKDDTEEKLLSFSISNDNFNEKYDITPISQRKNSVRVPILMYHQIENMPSKASRFVSGLYVTPLDFEKQLAYLVKHNYKTVTPKELYDLLKTGKNPKQKSVMLTFDDSVKSHYTAAYPLLKKYGFTGVFYVVSSRSSINHSQLKEMANNGMIIDSHSATHKDLTKVTDPAEISYEVVTSKINLTARTNKQVQSIAYPGCVASSQVFPYVSTAGYLIGVSCGKNIDHYFNQRLYLARIHVFTDIGSFINILSGVN